MPDTVETRRGAEPADEGDVGVYLHVPFCERVCPYCDFAVVGGSLTAATEARYVAALCAELERRIGDFADRRLASIYFGGGTPSLLSPESVACLIDAVHAAVARPQSPGDAVEVSLEVNPSTLERGRLPGFRQAGVNRLSIGVQSFDDLVLKRLGRAHRAVEARRTFEHARASGFENLSLDLIFAAPGQTLESLGRDLDWIADLSPEHVSTYELVVEAGTPFATADARGQLARASVDEGAAMVERIDERLAAQGVPRYELTNYAKPGSESVHNRRYWERAPVLGLGMGAWSSDPPTRAAPHGSRSRNARQLAVYLDCIEAHRPAADQVELLEEATARGEAIFLGLRCTEGLPAARFERWFGSPPRAWFGAEIERLASAGLLIESADGDLRLSERGRMLCDEVSQAFV